MSKPERWSDYTHSCGCHQKSAECNQHFFDLVAPTKGNVKSIDVDELLIYFVGKKLTGVTFVKITKIVGNELNTLLSTR